MPVDVNNDFNDKEDRIQHAIGTMQAYDVIVEYLHYGQHIPSTGIVTTTGDTAGVFTAAARHSGIIAVNEAGALLKFIRLYPNDVAQHTLRVELCE